MLTLSRKLDEEIVIGDDIVVKILRIDGKQVKLGISAPPEVRVDRKEVRERIDAEKERPL